MPWSSIARLMEGDTGRDHTGKEGPVQVLLVYRNIRLSCPVVIPHQVQGKISTSVTNVIGNSL